MTLPSIPFNTLRVLAVFQIGIMMLEAILRTWTVFQTPFARQQRHDQARTFLQDWGLPVRWAPGLGFWGFGKEMGLQLKDLTSPRRASLYWSLCMGGWWFFFTVSILFPEIIAIDATLFRVCTIVSLLLLSLLPWFCLDGRPGYFAGIQGPIIIHLVYWFPDLGSQPFILGVMTSVVCYTLFFWLTGGFSKTHWVCCANRTTGEREK